MNKKGWFMVGIIAVLAAAVALLAMLNSQGLSPNGQSEAVDVTYLDQSETFDIAYLKGFEKTTFTANLDTNGQAAVEKSFGGVPLMTVLEDKGFDISAASRIVFKAADGYSTVVTREEMMDTDNIYVVYERDGKPSGAMAQGGTGPIEIVIKKDAFSQRWCKYLAEINIQ
jgi:hypothetical protein